MANRLDGEPGNAVSDLVLRLVIEALPLPQGLAPPSLKRVCRAVPRAFSGNVTEEAAGAYGVAQGAETVEQRVDGILWRIEGDRVSLWRLRRCLRLAFSLVLTLAQPRSEGIEEHHVDCVGEL